MTPGPASTSERVLVLMPSARDAERTASLLRGVDVESVLCTSMSELCREVGVGAGAVLTTEEIILGDASGQLAETMRAQPAWSAMPVLVMAREVATEHIQRATSEALKSLLIVERPVRTRTLLSVVLSALRTRRNQYEIRDAILAREQQTAVLREQQEKLALQAEQLREQDQRKDEFLAMLAHELRNPLAPIRTGLEVMQQVSGSLPATRRAQGIMERQLGHMVRLIDDLLDVSRISRGKVELRRERLSIQAVLSHALEASRLLIEASGHTLSVHVPDEPAWLDGDLTRLAQVVSNLLHNAAKYTPPGGHVELAAALEGSEVVVRVTDTGSGIAAEMLPRVFDLFTQIDRTLHRAQGGLGIGLSLARKLLELHGGRIAAASPGLGQGSTFTIRLPLAASPSSLDVPASPTLAAARQRRRVLVVDDNEDAAEMLVLVLGRQGHETSLAFSGPEALALVPDFRPEVIFLDIGMPGMDGYEVARRLRADPSLASTTLVALTGWGGEADKKKSREAGFDTHLTKPVEASAITAVLDRLPTR